MKIAQLFTLILSLFIVTPASAGLLLEPVVGYNLGGFEIDSDGWDKENMRGPSVGGRIGYQNFGFQIGLDYLRSNLDIDDKDFKKDLAMNEFAGFVGFEFPILLRVYAGYIFSATGDSEYDNGTRNVDAKFKDGTGVKMGVGFTGLPFIDINFEYRKGTFKEYKLGSTKHEDDTDYNSFMIGLSLPFVL